MSDKRFLKLWTDYLEGELDEAGLAELRALLAVDERLLRIAADTYQTHRLLGLVADERRPGREDFIRQTLARLTVDGDAFTHRVMQRLSERGGDGPTDKTTAARPPQRAWRHHRRWALAATAAALAAATLLLTIGRPPDDRAVVRDGAGSVLAAGRARLESAAGARFFGELSPPVGSALMNRRDYVLMAGLVEVGFPCGASAIIEGPAVFRVLSNESLGLDVGRCSVHAPAGAEGFRVETPFTRVVDRGTRFTVSVAETSETEVQVIEGMAEVHGRPEGSPAPYSGTHPAPKAAGTVPKGLKSVLKVHLTSHEARRFGGPNTADMTPALFTPSVYRRGLPDRVIAFEATSAAGGGAENLTSLTMQRGGELRRYPVAKLIPVELTWFRSADIAGSSGHLTGGAVLPPRRGDLLSDAALNTGVVNPGGSVRPLDSDPVVGGREGPDEAGTPGFAVRFRTPVINGPGPDVVFFELQSALHPPDGDAFHVSPLKFRGGRRSNTVRVYDLTMTSPEALKLAVFSLYRFRSPVASLAALETGECLRTPQSFSFHALAVGIDLSDLGYHDGERVDGLFFQDAEDDGNRVDPVLIAGLPEP